VNLRARKLWRRPSLAVAIGATAHLLGLELLDRAGLMEHLLAPSSLGAALWAIVALAFLLLRVVLVLAGPGVLLADGVLLLADLVRRTRASSR